MLFTEINIASLDFLDTQFRIQSTYFKILIIYYEKEKSLSLTMEYSKQTCRCFLATIFFLRQYEIFYIDGSTAQQYHFA